MANGYFNVSRKLLDSPIWVSETFTRGQAWIDLIGLANYRPGAIRKRGIVVPVERGQIGYSEDSLAKRWSWSRGKVRRFLAELCMEQQIEQQKSNVCTLITIVNYEMYQTANGTTSSTASSTTNGHQTVQQTDTKEEEEEEKEEEKRKKARARQRFVKPTLDEVKEYCFQKGYTFDAEAFVAFYDSNGWRVGRNPMKDWKKACVTWQKRKGGNKDQYGLSQDDWNEVLGDGQS